MNLAFINGSPKNGNNNTGMLLKALENTMDKSYNITHYSVNHKPLSPEQYRELCQYDVLVLGFPIYVDAIPSHFFRMLETLEGYLRNERTHEIYMYAVMNNGFYEGIQQKAAAQILKNYCARAGITYGQSLGTGAGEMLSFIDKVPVGYGPLKNLGNALANMNNNISALRTGDDIFFNPNFPRFLWRMASSQFFWNQMAKKNHLKRKDLLRTKF